VHLCNVAAPTNKQYDLVVGPSCYTSRRTGPPAVRAVPWRTRGKKQSESDAQK